MTMPDTVKDLTPSTTKEWLMTINGKLEDALESQADDRDAFIKYMEKIDKWIECHDRDKVTEVRQFSTLVEKVDHVEKKVNGWNVLNSLGVIIAAILGALGLKGS